MKIMSYLKHMIKDMVNPKSKRSFIYSLRSDASVLDIGCGNNSPFYTKSILPNCNYVGVDIGDYNQTKPNYADQYILTTSDRFHITISEIPGYFDAILSVHNLEHCNDRIATLDAMISKLSKGGRIYITFPCYQSIDFPNRSGTLNYYDDPTHKFTPPDFNVVISKILSSGLEIEYSTQHYRPLVLRSIGFIVEPISFLFKRVFRGTWAYWGFESIIVARKP